MDPNCPANCESPLPVVSSTNCDPEINLSEIEWVLMGKPDTAPISDVSSLVSWQERINNSSADANAIRQIAVSGDLPLPADTEITYSRNRKKVLDRLFTLNADVDETDDTNYNAVRQWQCGSRGRFWFVSRSGHIFGGKDGILADVKAGITLERGENAIQKFPFVFTWRSKFNPERNKWPLAGIDAGGSTTFDTVLEFSTSATDNEAGVSATVTGTNAIQQLEFKALTAPSGTPETMTIEVASTEVMTVDYPGDYSGKPFKYTHTNGTEYNGVFTNGTVGF